MEDACHGIAKMASNAMRTSRQGQWNTPVTAIDGVKGDEDVSHGKDGVDGVKGSDDKESG